MTPRTLVRLVVASLCCLVALFAWHKISEALDARKDWVDTKDVIGSTPTASHLFRALAQKGLVRFAPETTTVDLAPPDLHLLLQLKSSGVNVADDHIDDWSYAARQNLFEIERLIRLLYRGGEGQPGVIVRDAVRQWNESHGFVAVRDNLSIDRYDGKRLPPAQRWRAGTRVKFQQDSLLRGVDTNRGLDLDLYGFMASGADAPKGPWTRAAPDIADDTARLEFRKRIPPSQSVGTDTFVLDVVGRDPEVRVQDPETGVSVTRNLSIRELCPNAANRVNGFWLSSPSAFDCNRNNPGIAWRIMAPLDDVQRDLLISVAPIRILPDVLEPFAKAGAVTVPLDCRKPDEGPDVVRSLREESPSDRSKRCWGDGWTPYLAAGAIAIYCRTEDAELNRNNPECGFDWRIPPKANDRRPAEVSIKTADGLELVSNDVERLPDEDEPTPIVAPDRNSVLSLGLGELVGYGEGDRLGLLAHLHRRYDPEIPEEQTAEGNTEKEGKRSIRKAEITLTIDSRIQQSARTALQKVVNPDLRTGNYLLDRFDNIRRAAIVLIDAGDRCASFQGDCTPGTTRGDVLAAANWPEAKLDRSPWNAVGYDYWRELFSPLGPFAWSRSDSQFAPGSTFKVVTSLAAIKHAAADTTQFNGRLEDLLRGNGRIAAMNALLPQGVSLSQHALEVRSKTPFNGPPISCGGEPEPQDNSSRRQEVHRLCNFGTSGLEASATLSLARSGCEPNGNSSSQLGLCEAVISSQNVWFEALAWALEGDSPSWVTRTPAILPRDRSWVKFGMPAVVQMAHRIAPPERASLLPNIDGPSAARWKTDGFLIETARPFSARDGNFPNRVLSVNAIGQNMQANPMTMASVMASTATGCAVRPRMSAANTPQRCNPLFFDDDSYKEKLALGLMSETLWRGMSGVINSPSGTAYRYFQDKTWAEHVSAKTGTAEFGLNDLEWNTGWLSGWFEPQSIPGLNRRIAFACMVTHVRKGGFGADACAPAIRDIIEDLRLKFPETSQR